MKEEINCDEDLTAIQNPLEQPSSPIISVKNHIYLYNDIDTTVTRALFVAMHEMAAGIIQTATDNNTNINPIILHINSVGGSNAATIENHQYTIGVLIESSDIKATVEPLQVRDVVTTLEDY